VAGRLKEHYAGGESNMNEQLKRDVSSFFSECNHVADWLWTDPDVKNVDETEVRDYISKDQPLKICRAFSNTSKHPTLTGKSRMTAEICTKHDDGSVLIEWRDGDRSGRVDALELAMQCMASWRRFLKSKELSFLDILRNDDERQ
jgi:hypothetical protein